MDTTAARKQAELLRSGYSCGAMTTAEHIRGLADAVDRLTSEITSAKEEIGRLTADNCKPAEEVCELCQPLTDMHAALASAKEEIERLKSLAETRLFGLEEAGKIALAAESALTAERKEAERLRELASDRLDEIERLKSIIHPGYIPHAVAEERKAALNPPQQEEQ